MLHDLKIPRPEIHFASRHIHTYEHLIIADMSQSPRTELQMFPSPYDPFIHIHPLTATSTGRGHNTADLKIQPNRHAQKRGATSNTERRTTRGRHRRRERRPTSPPNLTCQPDHDLLQLDRTQARAARARTGSVTGTATSEASTGRHVTRRDVRRSLGC